MCTFFFSKSFRVFMWRCSLFRTLHLTFGVYIGSWCFRCCWCLLVSCICLLIVDNDDSVLMLFQTADMETGRCTVTCFYDTCLCIRARNTKTTVVVHVKDGNPKWRRKPRLRYAWNWRPIWRTNNLGTGRPKWFKVTVTVPHEHLRPGKKYIADYFSISTLEFLWL